MKARAPRMLSFPFKRFALPNKLSVEPLYESVPAVTSNVFLAVKSRVRKLIVPIADSPAVGPFKPAPLSTST